MKSFYTLLLLSTIGIAIALVTIFYDDKITQAKTEPIIQMHLPFASYVAGTGIVEAESKNIPVGASVSGVITHVYVKSGQSIKAGDKLFSIDDRAVQNTILTAKSNIEVAKAQLVSAQDQFQILNNLKKINSALIIKKEYSALDDDVKKAKSSLELAKEEVVKLNKDLKLYTVHAPMDAIVLQCKMNIGEYFNVNSPNALMILGSSAMNLRVDINEYDAWKFEPNTKAIAFVRGHPELKTALKYSYTEPYIVPKTNLTGLSTERTDTRVLQIIYALPKEVKFPLYVGQQLDVFIETDKKEK